LVLHGKIRSGSAQIEGRKFTVSHGFLAGFATTSTRLPQKSLGLYKKMPKKHG